MRIIFLFFLVPLLSNCSKVRSLSVSQIRARIDSSVHRDLPSRDLLPPEFNSPSLENEYYCNYDDNKNHVTVLRVRDNQAFIYETYYKPYNWSRIDYRIGNYHISGDTIHITYKPLLKGKAEYNYIQPTIAVSWIPPRPPAYLLLDKGRLQDPVAQRMFYYLTDKPQFDLGNQK